MTENTMIKEGYRAFNGYTFDKHDANLYNRACKDPQATPEQVHKIFVIIVTQTGLMA